MDPATVALAIRALDIAFVIGTYYMRKAETHEELDDLVTAVDEIRRVRNGLEDGTIAPDEAKTRVSSIQATALAPMRRAIERL